MTSHRSLRRVLAADAAGMTAFGLAYLLAGGPIARLLGVAEALVLGAGAAMLLIGAAVGLLAGRPRPAPVPLRLVITAGAGWMLASLAALTFGWVSPNTKGTAWIILQTVPPGPGHVRLPVGHYARKGTPDETHRFRTDRPYRAARPGPSHRHRS